MLYRNRLEAPTILNLIWVFGSQVDMMVATYKKWEIQCLLNGINFMLVIKHGKRVHILLFYSSIERLSVKFFDVYSKPYFRECTLLYSLQQSFLTNFAKAYRPIHNGNTFLVQEGMRAVEFEAVEPNCCTSYCHPHRFESCIHPPEKSD